MAEQWTVRFIRRTVEKQTDIEAESYLAALQIARTIQKTTNTLEGTEITINKRLGHGSS